MGGFARTKGVDDYLFENSCFWLFIEILRGQQAYTELADQSFQVWTLQRIEGKVFQMCISDGNDNMLLTYVIPFSNFPHDEVTLWMVDNTVLFPDEY